MKKILEFLIENGATIKEHRVDGLLQHIICKKDNMEIEIEHTHKHWYKEGAGDFELKTKHTYYSSRPNITMISGLDNTIKTLAIYI